jgi:hypothetical protein
MGFNLFEGETPELKLPLFLKANTNRGTDKHPHLVGYCHVTRATVRELTRMLDEEETVMLQVALWDDTEEGRTPRNPLYPIAGEVSYREFSHPVEVKLNYPKSDWY